MGAGISPDQRLDRAAEEWAMTASRGLKGRASTTNGSSGEESPEAGPGSTAGEKPK
jgi:hypothetical protein